MVEAHIGVRVQIMVRDQIGVIPVISDYWAMLQAVPEVE